ncbi:putative Phage integrase [Pseudomonas coronafaciens pv. zizaniae]|nr:putative Phage integrase [Pseudomonas coronafaciens pv. zizaniae]RMN24427.1 putative Phage integrase [Pseudomonas coronafaciens pv. zizaniae]
MHNSGIPNSLSLLMQAILLRNSKHICHHFILSTTGMRASQQMLRNGWDEAREAARLSAIADGRAEDAEKIRQFQFRDIRPKAA